MALCSPGVGGSFSCSRKYHNAYSLYWVFLLHPTPNKKRIFFLPTNFSKVKLKLSERTSPSQPFTRNQTKNSQWKNFDEENYFYDRKSRVFANSLKKDKTPTKPRFFFLYSFGFRDHKVAPSDISYFRNRIHNLRVFFILHALCYSLLCYSHLFKYWDAVVKWWWV